MRKVQYTDQPIIGTVQQTTEAYPIGRSRLYAMAREHPNLFIQTGKRAIAVDWSVLDDLIRQMPRGIGTKKTEKATAAAAAKR